MIAIPDAASVPMPAHDIVCEGLDFPEGPIALPDGSLLVVEIGGRCLTRISSDARVNRIVELGGGPNGAAIGPDGAVYICNNGGALKLKADKSRAAVQSAIASPLGLSVEQASFGAHVIAASNMIRAIRAVSSERGRDPREYTLIGFGGNGPIFAAVMAQTLMIARAMIPPSAGVFSALGLLCADVEYHLTRTRLKLFRDADPGEISALYSDLEDEARQRLSADGFGTQRIATARSATLHYQGQSDELEVSVPQGILTRAALAAVEEAFNAEHERTYGHRAGAEEPIELVSLRVVGRGIPTIPRAEQVAKARLPDDIAISKPIRPAYFGPKHGWLETRVINRSRLSTPHAGPCIVEEYDSTCVIPPGCTAGLDRFGNIVIAIAPPALPA